MPVVQAGGFVADGRVNGSLNLSRAIGDLEYKQTKELGPGEQMVTAMPEVRKETLQPGDTFIFLACDGELAMALFAWLHCWRGSCVSLVTLRSLALCFVWRSLRVSAWTLSLGLRRWALLGHAQLPDENSCCMPPVLGCRHLGCAHQPGGETLFAAARGGGCTESCALPQLVGWPLHSISQPTHGMADRCVCPVLLAAARSAVWLLLCRQLTLCRRGCWRARLPSRSARRSATTALHLTPRAAARAATT